MRVLIATSNRGVLGGVEKYLQSVIPGLIQRGHSAGLLYEYPFGGAEEAIDHEGGQIESWCSRELGAQSTLRSIASWKPDVVYSQGLDDSLLEATLLEKYPSILYAHTYYGTCVSGRKCHSWPRLAPCDRQFGAPCLALYFPRRCGGLSPGTMWQLFQLQSKRKARLQDYQAILVASRHMYHEYQLHGVSPTRLHLVPLHTTDVSPSSTPPARDPQGRILFAGRLMDVKGVGYLLEATCLAATKLDRPLTLTIAGDGPERAKLQESARRLGIAVEFTGWVDSEKKLLLMREADLVAVPSLWPEPFGLVGIEAGCLGVPAVGFAVGGIPDWLIPGQSGELAPGDPPTVAGLADAMVRALADPAHYRKLCLGAWEMAKQFSIERHIAQLEWILSITTSVTQLIPTHVEMAKHEV
jgi:glycosyltransferase involved in cell wall biosynthesis